MQGAQPPFQIVIPSQLHHQVSRQPPKQRPLSVDEAWRFTPLTTTPLQPASLLPIPNYAAVNRNAKLSSKAERSGAANTKLTATVRDGLQDLLKPEELAEIKFKRSPRKTPSQRPKLDLSPLAKQVLEIAQVEHRFPSSNPSKSSQTTPQVANGVAPSQDSRIKVPTRQAQVIVSIPQPSSEFRREDYVSVPDSPKRRRLSNEALDSEAALRLRTQREQGDATVSQLQDLLLEIFQVQDRLQMDISNGIYPSGVMFFDLPDAEEDHKLRLSLPTLDRLHTMLKNLGDWNRLGDMHAGDLKRLLQICDVSIDIAQTLNLRLGHDPSDEDLSTWKTRINRVTNGAASACVFLYSTAPTPSDGSAPSQEALQSVPNLLVNVYENCLIPIIESRPDGQEAELYTIATSNQDDLKALLDMCKKLLDLLASTCVQVSAAAECVNMTEFLAAKLIFVQNASTEKTSALGSQQYERVRKQAMFSLARIYAAFPDHRSPILDEILSSLDKLPSTSRSARQYKLRDGRNVMLISALFLQLVQTSALESAHRPDDISTKKSRRVRQQEDSDEEGSTDVEEDVDGSEQVDDLVRLRRKADELFSPASRSSQEIVYYLVGKASKVSKTGDSPYRNILDMFIEDLVNLLQDLQWPAAELLLRVLAIKMTELANTEKAAGIKNMALESLGTMGSAISEVRATARSLAASLSRDADGRNSEISHALAQYTDQHFATGLTNDELFDAHGPFALTAQCFDKQMRGSLRAKSARNFFLAQYAWFRITRLKVHNESQNTMRQARELLEALSDIGIDSNSSLSQLNDPRESNLAYLLSILNLAFCGRYESIVRTLLSSLSSDQAQVRSRSLKSVVTILETDPSLLDRDPLIADDVFRCASDDSAMVRDAALSVIAKFIVSKPALEEKGIRKLLACASDNKIGVQKRAISHLADIYAQETRPTLKAIIAKTFLQRTVDHEDSISNLAKTTLTEAWISPYLPLFPDRAEETKSKIALSELTSHIVDTIRHDAIQLPPLFTRHMMWLLKNSKTADRVSQLLDRIVQVLFQSVIEGSANDSSLLVLTSIAEAHPQSVAPQQLSHLKRYLEHITPEELPMFTSVISIFRHVLPRLSISHQTLLKDIQDDLFKSLVKLNSRSQLDEVTSCLRTIDRVLENGWRFVKLLDSIMKQLSSLSQDEKRLVRLIRITGSIGKNIDLDRLPAAGHIHGFTKGSFPGFLTDNLYSLAANNTSAAVQMVTMDSLGAICQSWPLQFNKIELRNLFTTALSSTSTDPGVTAKSNTQLIALRIFEGLYSSLALIKEEPDADVEKPLEKQDLKKIGGSKRAQDDNSALSSMATHIYKQIVHIALNEEGEKALLAVRILSSVAARGMFHPRDYAHVFLALETSADPEIRDAAEKAHQLSHQHHESHWEREYVNAVRQAFVYQQTHCEDPTGAWQSKAKLASCFNIVNSSGSKYVKKFVSTLISRLGTDYTKLDTSKPLPDHVHFVRFVAQNLALFDYTKQDDLLHTILQLELLFSKNGGEVAQAIETNIPNPADTISSGFKIPNGHDATAVELVETPLVNGEGSGHEVTAVIEPSIDLDLLKQLAAAACAVTMISAAKSYLKRQYGISRDVKAAMQQNKQTKESTKAPLKVHGITSEKFLAETRLILPLTDSTAGLMQRCRVFYQLMTVDEEVRVGEEGDEFRESYSASADPEAIQPAKASKKRKREGSSTSGTPKRAKGRPRKNSYVNGGRRSTSVSSREDPDGDYGE